MLYLSILCLFASTKSWFILWLVSLSTWLFITLNNFPFPSPALLQWRIILTIVLFELLRLILSSTRCIKIFVLTCLQSRSLPHTVWSLPLDSYHFCFLSCYQTGSSFFGKGASPWSATLWRTCSPPAATALFDGTLARMGCKESFNANLGKQFMAITSRTIYNRSTTTAFHPLLAAFTKHYLTELSL